MVGGSPHPDTTPSTRDSSIQPIFALHQSGRSDVSAPVGTQPSRAAGCGAPRSGARAWFAPSQFGSRSLVFARWLAALERNGLADSHRARKLQFCASMSPFAACAPPASARVHLRFIATFKLPFKFSPQDRGCPGRIRSPDTGTGCDRPLGWRAAATRNGRPL